MCFLKNLSSPAMELFYVHEPLWRPRVLDTTAGRAEGASSARPMVSCRDPGLPATSQDRQSQNSGRMDLADILIAFVLVGLVRLCFPILLPLLESFTTAFFVAWVCVNMQSYAARRARYRRFKYQ